MGWRRGDSASARCRLWGGLRDDGTGPASQGGVSVAVHEVKYQPDQEPDTESLPRGSRQTNHRVEAGEGAQNGHRQHKRNLERPRPVWISVPQNKHSDAYDRERGKGPDIREIVDLVLVG